MLVEFSVGNYRSFKETVTLSMLAADIASQPASLDTNNVFSARPDVRLLTSAAIYGANASGKSNLVQALSFMRGFVLNSSRESQATDAIAAEPFLLSTETEQAPSHFEIVFLIDGTQYRYGFEVNTKQVVAEWLYRLDESGEVMLFERDEQTISTHDFREGREEIQELTRPNALFLSVVAQFNGKIAGSILQWFSQVMVNMGIHERPELSFAVRGFAEGYDDHRKHIEQFITRLDVGIERFEAERRPATVPENMPKELAEVVTLLNKNFGTVEHINIRTLHRRFDAAGQPLDEIPFDLEKHESAGTQRLFALALPLLAALRTGRVLCIDELDARIHPNLVIELVQLFHFAETNPRHAQLIFTTHNTSLLSTHAQLFRRDQVWFTEKSRRGASDLYSLVEYRIDADDKDISFEKNYVMGRYGAIPSIGDLYGILGADVEQETANGE